MEDEKQQGRCSSASSTLSTFITVMMWLCLICWPRLVRAECKRNPIIFNFGDSNSDTGAYSAASGIVFGPPAARAFFHEPTGRLCDGRLLIDFLCESLNATYLSPYLNALEPNFQNGANFAASGAMILPEFKFFNLNVQVLQFLRFKTLSLLYISKGHTKLINEEDFKSGLYTIDIGHNDITEAFNNLTYEQVIQNVPSFVTEIQNAVSRLYESGGRNFWIHNIGPVGCLPQQLVRSKAARRYDKLGCIKPLNDAAKEFNLQLKALCKKLRSQMHDATIVYVDVYSIKHKLIVNTARYGFENPLMACCGYGGPPYNYKPPLTCGQNGSSSCSPELRYVVWDGVHYTEAANSFVASNILSSKYSTPKFKFNYFCNI